MKRYIAFCLFYTIVACLIAGDIRLNHVRKFEIASSLPGNRNFLTYCVCEGCLYNANLSAVMRIYDEEKESLKAVQNGDVDLALVQNPGIIFDNEMTDIRIILMFETDTGDCLAVCVSRQALEENLDLYFNLFLSPPLWEGENCPVTMLKPDEWAVFYNSPTLDGEDIMPYLAPDFTMEILQLKREESTLQE